MARIAYDDRDAEAFQATRHLSEHGLTGWRTAVAEHLHPTPDLRLLDLGAGTGSWATAFTRWYGVRVVAVEPSPAMRARSSFPGVVAGTAQAIPLRDSSVDAVWLSTVIHHIPDLAAAAAEIRRVTRPGSPVLIRSAFAGRTEGMSEFRFFPEAVQVIDSFPHVEEVVSTFGAAGFGFAALQPVTQISLDSLAEAAATLDRDAHTTLKLISDEAYAAGMNALRAAAATETGPVTDTLDLLVLR